MATEVRQKFLTPTGWKLRPGAPAAPTTPATLLSTTWDSYPSGVISQATWRTALGDQTIPGPPSICSLATVAGHGQVWQVKLPGGSVLATNSAAGVSAMAAVPGGPVDEAYLDYDVRFVGTGFDFGWGGKLPGLAGIVPGHGNPPTGGHPSIYGWSGRMMWITKGSYASVAGINELIGYLYDPTLDPNSYGVNRRTGKVITPEVWHHIRVHHKMNSINVEGVSGNPDGIHRIWLDGALVYTNTTQVYRIFAAGSITHFAPHNFYGGDSNAWAPATEQTFQFDNQTITKGAPS